MNERSSSLGGCCRLVALVAVLCVSPALACTGSPRPVPPPPPTTATLPPDPTPRWSSETEREAELIGLVEATALAFSSGVQSARLMVDVRTASLSPLTDEDFHTIADTVYAACEQMLRRTTVLAEEKPDTDLWPREYLALRDVASEACLTLGAFADEPYAYDPTSWVFRAGRTELRVQDALNALPDYSDAQLRDAIEDRR